MKKIKEQIVYKGQWLCVQETLYENKSGEKLLWETVCRTKSKVGVVVVARFKHSRKFICIKQYRPAINGYILSFPAGLGADDPNHALVELKEETGYVGKIVSISPVMKAGASLINDNAYIVCAEVDEHAPENKNPKQELEPAEDIEVVIIDPKDGKNFLNEQLKNGVQVAANLWYVFGMNNFLK